MVASHTRLSAVPDEQGALGYQSLGVGVAPIQEQLCSDPGSDELLHDREKYLAEHSKRFKEMFGQFGFPAFAATPELFSHGPIGYEVRVPTG